MSEIAVVTTFPSNMFKVYAEDMLNSFVQNWPAEVPILIQLDDDLLVDQVNKIKRPQDGLAVGVTKEHHDFVQRNKSKDDPTDYRKQCVRFSHKVFAIHRAWQAAKTAKEKGEPTSRYLIWMDADTVTNRPVTIDEIKECIPKEGEAVSYLGRKDWPHSECGWLAFDLDNEGGLFIDVLHGIYVSDEILKLKETHDSWAFDYVRQSKDAPPCTNLTEGKPGMDIWPHSPMGKWSTHKKGPVAKGLQTKMPQNSNVIIQTKNSIPHELIRKQISENQKLIKNWVRECTQTDEQIVVVSAGPQMVPELDVMQDYLAGKKIIAVKHALKPLKDAGIQPWACILLDPRPHVYDFVDDPDTKVIWFVASQVDPRVTARLLAKGCNVWGYHASVGADEQSLTELQAGSIISGGSATATRGLFLLKHLGFYKIKLVGYDLCFPDKVDLSQSDELGQPKYLEISLGWNDPLSSMKKCFWSKPELIAQFEEFNQLIQTNTFELEAIGDGIIPFILRAKKGGELRRAKLKAKMLRPVPYEKLLWTNRKKTSFLMPLLKRLFRTPRRT